MKKASFKGSTLKRVLFYVGRYPFSVAGVLLFSTLTVVASLLVPVFFGDAVDCIANKAVDWQGLKLCLIKVGVSAGVASLTQWLLSLCNNRISCSVVRDIRKDAFAKISRLPLGYIDSHSHGDIVSRIVADADQFSDGLLIGFTQFFTGIMTIVGTIVFMLATNWAIGLVVVVVTPVSLLVARFVTTHTHKFFVEQTATRGEQTAFTEEAISGLKTTQAFAHEKENEKKFNEINARLEKASLKAVFYSSLTNPATRFINNLVYALVALIGAFAVASGNGFTVGMLTKFLSYANQYTKPFNEITGVMTELKGAFACASRIFELIDEQEEISDEKSEVLQNATGKISFRAVDFSYDKDKELIKDLSLEVESGKRVAIVGKTGSGKTTLINLLMRFYEVDDGAIEIDGKDLRALTRLSLRQNYGMVLQETWLKRATVKENLKLGNPDCTDEEMILACKSAHAHGFIMRMEKGYDTLLGETGGLSEGQKQLLCIARVMLTKPKVLFLDEATSSIDTRTELKIGDAFDKLMENRTSFIVAHRLSTIVNSDWILVMKDGRVVEQGRHADLLALGTEYATLYNAR